MNRILVTGGSGFIGRATIAAMDARTFEIHATYFENTAKLGSDHVAWHPLQLMDPDAVSALLKRVRPTHLVSLAWYTGDRGHFAMPENIDWVRSTLHLTQAFVANGGRRAVYAGTYGEYGVAEGILDETVKPAPASLYAICKDALHRIIAGYAPLMEFTYSWARIFSVYGPHDAPYRVVPYALGRLLARHEALLTEGRQVRDFIHVADVGRALASIAGSDLTGPVNVGSGEGHAVRDVVQWLGEATGGSQHLRFGAVKQAPGETQRIVADVSRLRGIGWSPQHDLRSGLEDTVAWFRSRHCR